MEADIRREYGARLGDLFARDGDGRPRLTWRELASLVRGLPPGSATRTAMNDGVPEPTGEQVILADIADLVQWLDWHTVAAQATKSSELPKKPKPYPRYWNRKPSRRDSPQRVARIEDARQRAAERRRAIAEGRIA